MNAVGSFVMSVAASALMFSLCMFVLPKEGCGKTARLIAAVFMMTLVIKGMLNLSHNASDVLDISMNKDEQYSGDEYICMQAELAIESVVSDRLVAAGCEPCSVTAEAVYENGEFVSLDIYVTVTSKDDEEVALQVGKSLNKELHITVI